MQCLKQPDGSNLCGFFVCEYLRACRRYKSSYRQLKDSKNKFTRVLQKATDEMRFRRTVADICKFVLYMAVHEDQPYFNRDSELGLSLEFGPLRRWEELGLTDYLHPVNI